MVEASGSGWPTIDFEPAEEQTLDSDACAVSVIVPFFNNARTLGPCIESLLAVEHLPGELQIIVIDNGSSDDSASIARGFEGITVLEERTPGAYAARNAGLAEAKAPIIAFTDADCTVDSGWLKALRAALSEPSVGLVVGHVAFPEKASTALHLIGAWENAKTEFIAKHCPPENRIVYCNNLAVRASLFEELGPFREWLRAGDSEFAHRVARAHPEFSLQFDPAMRVTHHEFTRARDRARRLRLYTGTNRQIEGFSELTFGQRVGVLRHWLVG